MPHEAKLELYQVHAVTEGTDAQAEVSVRLAGEGRSVTARGADPDTLVASAKAYLGALNKLMVRRQRGGVAVSEGSRAFHGSGLIIKPIRRETMPCSKPSTAFLCATQLRHVDKRAFSRRPDMHSVNVENAGETSPRHDQTLTCCGKYAAHYH